MKRLIFTTIMIAIAFSTLCGFPVLNLPNNSPIQSPNLVRNRFTLTFEYACRQHTPLNSCTGQVSWNGVVILDIIPSNYNIIPISLNVHARVGRNDLQFLGTGVQDVRGLTIDNVKLKRNSQPFENIVVNGDFEEPRVNGDWLYSDNVKGWQGKQVQIGKGPHYNCRWNSQVCQLDSGRNIAITQIFYFNRFYDLVSGDNCQDDRQCDNQCKPRGKRDYLNQQDLLKYVWAFYNDDNLLGEMTFEHDGTISTYNNDNQRFWSLDNRGILSLARKDKHTSCKFIQSFKDYDGFWNLQGKFLFRNQWRHYLVQIRLR